MSGSVALTVDYEQTAVKSRGAGFHTTTGYAVTYGYEAATRRINSLAWDVKALTGTTDYAYEPISDLLRQAATKKSNSFMITWADGFRRKSQHGKTPLTNTSRPHKAGQV